MQKTVALLFCLFISSFLFAQQPQNIDFKKENFKDNKEAFKEALKALETGDKIFAFGRSTYKLALEHYLKANKFNPDNAQLNYKIGVCYLASIYKTKATPYLEKALKLNPRVSPDIHYMLGQAYHLNMEWEKAIREYNEYKNSLSPEEWKGKSKEVTKKIEECNYGKIYVKNPVRVFIDNLGSAVNSPYPEYVPAISADESVMFFTSRRGDATGGKKDESDWEYYEDIYLTTRTGNIWAKPTNLLTGLNTELHDAAISLSADGQKLFVYKGDNGGDIYLSILKGQEWSKPDRLPKTINTEFHESSASYSYDGKQLFFVTDKPEGSYGGRDIFVSSLDKKGKWGDPVNVGAAINTPYDEEGVFMHPDGKTMYFSSQGHKTMGGYDIFKSLWNDSLKQWSEPENMGYPINTPDDDVFFVVSASGKHAYYSSFRTDGYGEKDIYLVTLLGPEKIPLLNNEDNLLASVAAPVSEKQVEPVVQIKEAQLTILKGTTKDAITLQPVEAVIELTDNQKNEIIATFTSNSQTGRYLVSLPAGKNYGIAVKAEKYLFHSENFDIPLVAGYQEVNKDILLKKVDVGSTIVLRNIFFDFDKATLRPESASELERLINLLKDVPSMRIEISGHTDNKGSATYNQTLSENRSRSVVDYLVKKGIDAKRLEYKGYGMSMPIATNDTDEGRQQNRRTEFKILSK